MAAKPPAIDPIDPVTRGSRLSVSVPRKIEGFESPFRARRVGGAENATPCLTGSGFRCGARSTTPTMTAAAMVPRKPRFVARGFVFYRESAVRVLRSPSRSTRRTNRDRPATVARARVTPRATIRRARSDRVVSCSFSAIHAFANAAAQFADSAAHPRRDGILVDAHLPRDLAIL